MARRDVGDLMCHHARELGFLVGCQNQPRIHIEEPTGQREGVHFIGIDDLDGERHLRVGVAHQVLPDSVHILIDHRVLNHLGAGFHHLGVFLAHTDLAFDRIPVSHAAAPDFTVADGIHVVLSAVVLNLAVVGLLHRLRRVLVSWRRSRGSILVSRGLILSVLRQRRGQAIAAQHQRQNHCDAM